MRTQDTADPRDESPPKPGPPDHAATLDDALDQAWGHLARGVADRHHGFHQLTVCTVAPDGSPEARTVVLRGQDRGRGELRFHTDARSPKARQLRDDPRITWLLYDHRRKIQVRAAGTARVLNEGPEADEAWANTRLGSRRCYLAPGTPSERSPEQGGPDPNLPDDLRRGDPDRDRSEQGRPNFALVLGRIETLEWLHLKASGHVRARFRRDADGHRVAWDGAWIRP